MKINFLYLFIALFSYLHAGVVVGTIEHVKGNVKVKKANSIKKQKVVLGLELESGDLLISAKNAVAKVKLKDGSLLVLDERSSLYFKALNSIEQKSGKVLYKITSRDAKHSLKVTTPFAIIGIKGTTFIVNSSNDNSYITLKEGLIGVQSLKEEFALYRQKVQEEFENYLAQEEQGFEKFKNAQNEYQEVEYTKEFDLYAGHRISFSNQKVEEQFLVDEYKNEFEHFEELINNL